MKIYTRTGDDGTTGLFGGGRVAKASARVEAYGTVDEANAAIGVVRCEAISPAIDEVLRQVQDDLFTLGAELACVPGKEANLKMTLLSTADAERLEGAIDTAEEGLPPLTAFVLPGGTRAAAALHVARTVSRRAERCVLAAHESAPVRSELVVYLNRLSDLLFVLARRVNHEAGVADVPWKKALAPRLRDRRGALSQPRAWRTSRGARPSALRPEDLGRRRRDVWPRPRPRARGGTRRLRPPGAV